MARLTRFNVTALALGFAFLYLPIVILVISFVIGVLAAIYPAWRATRTDIMQAISTT